VTNEGLRQQFEQHKVIGGVIDSLTGMAGSPSRPVPAGTLASGSS